MGSTRVGWRVLSKSTGRNTKHNIWRAGSGSLANALPFYCLCILEMTPWLQQWSSHRLDHRLLCKEYLPCSQLQRLPHLHLVQPERVPNAVAAQLCHSGTAIRLSYWVAALPEELMCYHCCRSLSAPRLKSFWARARHPFSATNKRWCQAKEHRRDRKLYAPAKQAQNRNGTK
jgi:hypothetical protein